MGFYDFKMNGIGGESVDFQSYKGKKILLVNVASECGFTPQYEDLQNLHEQFGDKLTILGFPANDFDGQEPKGNDEIANFCQVNFGVTFQMFEKIKVLGPERHPLYAWLEAEAGRAPNWNFCKYLVDENGKVITLYPTSLNPMDETITGQL
jgi:glutathione peroxidase